jgi:nitrite reductase (NADH) small subunit
MTWFSAGRLTSLPPRGARVLSIGGLGIAVFRTGDDRVFALRDRCPHRGGPLSQGIVHGDCVTCPLHDWVIDLNTGAATGADEGRTTTFEVRIEDGAVLVDIPDASLRVDVREHIADARTAAVIERA